MGIRATESVPSQNTPPPASEGHGDDGFEIAGRFSRSALVMSLVLAACASDPGAEVAPNSDNDALNNPQHEVVSPSKLASLAGPIIPVGEKVIFTPIFPENYPLPSIINVELRRAGKVIASSSPAATKSGETVQVELAEMETGDEVTVELPGRVFRLTIH